MPCINCNNGKHGRCQFKTLEACKKAAAINIQGKKQNERKKVK